MTRKDMPRFADIRDRDPMARRPSRIWIVGVTIWACAIGVFFGFLVWGV